MTTKNQRIVDKNILNVPSLFFVFYSFIFLFAFLGCENQQNKLYQVKGYTQGTTYEISYINNSPNLIQEKIDSLLSHFSSIFSTYDTLSLISRLNENKNTDTMIEIDAFFYHLFITSKILNEQSEGSFDPGILPLVHFWKTAHSSIQKYDSLAIDSIRLYSSIQNWVVSENSGKYFIQKKHPLAALDFNAIAQGYSVDWVADFLEKNNIENYMVEIGGEIRCKGKNLKQNFWQIGIDLPENSNASNRKLKAIVSLENKALATSGNYRNFKIIEGKKYGHTLNPISGYPSYNTTLSTTVIADSATIADAYATLFMVWGWEKSLAFVAQNNTLEAYFIYTDSSNQLSTISSNGLQHKIKEL